ncbi:MAG: hypothetical protein HQM08_16515 [Candidatus Riflebacteria bacterium]|nr:hypothetical protein [Candidatus Riflebacteria bacterium]
MKKLIIVALLCNLLVAFTGSAENVGPIAGNPIWKVSVYNVGWPVPGGNKKIQSVIELLKFADQQILNVRTLTENNAGRICEAEVSCQPFFKVNAEVLKSCEKKDLSFNALGTHICEIRNFIQTLKCAEFNIVKVEFTGWTNGGAITNARIWCISKFKYDSLLKIESGS